MTKTTDPLKKRSKAHIRYKLADGTQVPGTTTVLGVLAKPALIHWAWDLGMQGLDYRTYRDAAANIGTLAHHLVQCDLSGATPDVSSYCADDQDKAENALLKWYEWRKARTIEPILVETPLVSEEYRFGGTIDCYGLVDGVPTLLDLKTGRAVYPEHLTQVAAYRLLLQEHGHEVQRARILNIGRTESEAFVDHAITDFSAHEEMFKHCLAVYRLQKGG